MSDPTFDKSFALVIDTEKGYVNDPNDPGGETKYGISKRAYPHEDIVNLTVDRAKEIYYADYWTKAGCIGRPFKEAYPLFDCAVNQGVGKAIALKKTAPEGAEWLPYFLTERALAYASNPTGFARFGRGWLRRLFDVQAGAMAD